MKFGFNYDKHQIAEWADAYMNYAALKRLCKGPRSSSNLQELSARCIDALGTIDRFYCDNYTTLLLKLSSKSRIRDADHDIHARFIGHFDGDGLDYVDLQHNKAAFTESLAEFDKLRWYGRVNTDGFRKITCRIRSLGRDGPCVAAQLEGTLGRLEFATQARCLEFLGNLHKIIALITRAQQNLPEEPSRVQDRFCIRLAKVDPSIPAFRFFHAVEKDDSLELERLIDTRCKGNSTLSRTKFLYVLFQCSIRCSQHSWVDVLISHAVSHDVVVVIQSCLRNVITELCCSSNKAPQANSSGHGTSCSLLTYMLDRLLARKLDLLYEQDHLGRIPLHYACEGGSTEACEIILESMKAWEQFDAGETKSAVLLRDMQSRSPIQISVLNGHLGVTDTLMHVTACNTPSDLAAFRSCFSELLLFAIKSNSTEAVACLLNYGADVNWSDALGQTPLYLAARLGLEMVIRLLFRYEPVIDKPETTKNWTPLVIASLVGFATIAEVLLEHGANVEHRDHAGWTAIDHASYRGHIPLAKTLSKAAAADLSYKQAAKLQHQFKTSSKRKLPAKGQPRRTISTTETYVVVNLGSLDSLDPAPAVLLSPHLIENPSIMYPQSMFSLGISIVGTTNPTYQIPLPLLEDATNKPWTFTIDASNTIIVFELSRNEPADTEGRELIGRGMALLDSYKRSYASKRESLSRDITIPILSTVGLEYIGAVTFSFIISTPLVLPNTPTLNTEALWSENGPSKVVGHRGLGQNVSPPTKLQIGENTIQSYLSAMHMGASYVELDVQLTKDHVPVIYHDFLVSETGIDAPMHTITYEQFKHINNEQSHQRSISVPGKVETEYFKTPLSRKVRTLSVNASDGIETKAFEARVKHTFDYSSRGCKGNTRGDFIHDTYVTFEQLLRNLPPSIALNIEIKYPMLSEATVDWKMDPFFVEANFFTDTVLLCLSTHILTRAVLLSSFSPEICILLARKQSRWPVAFLTDSGNWKLTDVRTTNLQEAVSFARKWELDGVVLASEPFVLAPQLVGFVKGKDIVCATYGALNDEVDGVTIQAMTGVDIIIVNNVRLASETLAAIGHK